MENNDDNIGGDKYASDFFKRINFNLSAPGSGKLLISEPFLFDPYFKRTVVYLVEHDEKGSVGFILNKPVNDITIEDAVDDFPDFDAELNYGGPVEEDKLFFIHNSAQLEGAVQISNNLYWGGDFDHLKILISMKLMAKDDVKFFVGYSGWGEGQLEQELLEKSWIVADAGKVDIMKSSENFWKETLSGLGKKYEILSNFPEDPSLN